MATTIDVTTENGTPYTWATANFDWNDTQADKSWENAANTIATVNVGEPYAINDVMRPNINKRLLESIHVADTMKTSLQILRKDVLSIGETYWDNINFALKIAESFVVNELRKSTIMAIRKDQINFTEKVIKTDNKYFYEAFATQEAALWSLNKIVSESFHLLETSNQAVTFLRTLAESLVVNEVLNKNVQYTREFAETIGVVQTYWDNIAFALRLMESIGISENEAKTVEFHRTIAESLAVADAMSYNIARLVMILETLGISDFGDRTVDYKRTVLENIGTAEADNQTVSFQRLYAESIVLIDCLKRNYEQTNKEILHVIENKNISYEKLDTETLQVSEIKSIATEKNIFEVLHLAETYWDNVNFALRILEAFAIQEGQHRNITHSAKETLGVGEFTSKHDRKYAFENIVAQELNLKAVSKKLSETLTTIDTATQVVNFLRTIAETLHVAEAPAQAVDFHRLFAEAAHMADSYKSSVNKELREIFSISQERKFVDVDKLAKENVGVTEATHRNLATLRKETLHVAETYWDNIAFIVRCLENIHVGEVIHNTNTFKRTWNESVALNENAARINEFNRLWQEAFGTTEGYANAVQFIRKTYETLWVNEGPKKNTAKDLQDAFAISDLAAKLVGKPLQEALRVTDKKAVNVAKLLQDTLHTVDFIDRNIAFVRKFFETFGTSDKIKQNVETLLRENFSMADKIRNTYQKAVSENFAIASDTFSRQVDFKLKIEEIISSIEGVAMEYGLEINEAINLLDDYITNVKAVLSNIAIREGEMTLADFQNAIATPPGYNTFRDFVVGDYEYQKALMRIVINAPATASQPAIKDVIPYVDIEDTDDRGEVTITQTATATKVYFNKFYYNAPEVNVTLKGGSGVITPNIVSTTGLDEGGRYFEVELLNGSGNRVTGTFSWTSKGY